MLALWHCAQLVLLDGALAWINASDGMAAKLVLTWQAVQAAEAALGIWLAGLDGEVKSTKLPWQLEQSPASGCAASTKLKLPPAAVGRV